MPFQYYPQQAPYYQQTYQQPLGQMQQPQQIPIAQQTPTIQGRMVTSREEALGIPVDFTGSPMFFPDLAHGVVYFKQFNQGTGSSDFREFRIADPQQNQPTYATTEMIDALKAEVGKLKEDLAAIQKPAKKGAPANE